MTKKRNIKAFYLNRILVIIFTYTFFYLILSLQNFLTDYFYQVGLIFYLYLPAGIAFLSLLIGGIYAAFGILLVLVPKYASQYPDTNYLTIVSLIIFSMAVQLLVIRSFLYFSKIEPNLKNLKHNHILILAMFFSASHSLCHHLNLVFIAGYQVGWGESLLVVRTFLGIFTALFILWTYGRINKFLCQKNVI